MEEKGPITLLAFLYRAWCRLRTPLAQAWCRARAGFWDNAVEGSAPLRAAVARLALYELAVEEGKLVGIIYWDMAKFHDSVSMPKLLRNAQDLEFPLVEFGAQYLGILGATRVMVDGSYGDPILAQGTLTAGCGF